MKCNLLLLLACAGIFSAGCSDARSAFTPMAAARTQNGAHTSAQEQVLYSFSGYSDGGDPATALTFDATGNLYGTTVIGGKSSCGTVFELTPPASPPWQERVLYSFSCYGDGKNPYGGVVFDRKGVLYGTTVAGGAGCSDGCGTVYSLAGSVESVVHDFGGGSDGFGPGGAVTLLGATQLYGTTPDGGSGYQGVVYELTGKTHHERIVHAFTGGDDGGVGSLGALLADKSGDLFGVTEEGGKHAAGTAFEISHKTKKLMTIYAFKNTPDAGSPYGGLVADASGNLYGATYEGGANGLGAVYELSPDGARYSERVLYSFRGGADGSASTSTLIFGTPGVLYGTTSAGGGSCDCGTIFSLDVKTRKEQVRHAFGSGGDGAYPYYGMTMDSRGNFYGTAVAGGSAGQGVVFEFTP